MSQLPNDVSYLASDYSKKRRCPAMSSLQFSEHNILQEAYRQRARRYASNCLGGTTRFIQSISYAIPTGSTVCTLLLHVQWNLYIMVTV